MDIKVEQTHTIVFGDLSEEDKSRFLQVMLNNQVEFAYDETDDMYVATIQVAAGGQGY